MKFVGSVEFEIYGHLYGENLNDVTMTSFPIWFLWNADKSAKGISKRHTNFQFDQTYESWDIQLGS